MGGSVELEGKRRTRSSVKGPPATPPPPAKKARPSTTPSRRGRPKRDDHSDDEKVSNELNPSPSDNTYVSLSIKKIIIF